MHNIKRFFGLLFFVIIFAIFFTINVQADDFQPAVESIYGTTNTEFTIDYDNIAGSGDSIILRFATTIAKLLSYDIDNTRFVFNDDLRIEGNNSIVGQNYIANDQTASDSDGIINLGINNSVFETISWDDVLDSFSISDDLDLNLNQLIKTRIENLSSSPTCDAGSRGRLYSNTGDNNSYVCNGSTWAQIDSSGSTSNDLSTVQIRRTSTYAATTSFVDITFDTTDIETNPGVVKHDDVNTDQIDIFEQGTYLITYSVEAVNSSATYTLYSRVRLNDVTVINGSSLSNTNYSNEFVPTSASFITTLNANDYITLQISRSSAATISSNQIVMTITKLEGIQGAPGVDGSGSNVSIADEGINIPNTPHSTLNFTGLGVDVTDGGSDVANISIRPRLGASPPVACSSTVTGMNWVDTDTGMNYVCDTSNSRNKWLSPQDLVFSPDETGNCDDGNNIANDHRDCSIAIDIGMGKYLPHPITITGVSFSHDDDVCTSGSYDLEVWSTGSSANDETFTLEQTIVSGLTGEIYNTNNSNIDIAGNQYVVWGIDNNCNNNLDKWSMVLYFRWRHD